MIRAGGCLLAACAILFSARAASCRTLQVGPDRELKTAAAAARMVEDGDRVVFDPGEYFDCAIWRANGITIETATPAGADRTVPSDVVFTDLACGRKAAFVIGGALWYVLIRQKVAALKQQLANMKAPGAA